MKVLISSSAAVMPNGSGIVDFVASSAQKFRAYSEEVISDDVTDRKKIAVWPEMQSGAGRARTDDDRIMSPGL